MERQEAIQGVRIVLTSYTASFRVPFSRIVFHPFLDRMEQIRGAWQGFPSLIGAAFAAALAPLKKGLFLNSTSCVPGGQR
jgi:hypothetical protein